MKDGDNLPLKKAAITVHNHKWVQLFTSLFVWDTWHFVPCSIPTRIVFLNFKRAIFHHHHQQSLLILCKWMRWEFFKAISYSFPFVNRWQYFLAVQFLSSWMNLVKCSIHLYPQPPPVSENENEIFFKRVKIPVIAKEIREIVS